MTAESREQRISNLATTLKTSGVAKSDSQARMMAEEMIGVEEHVQRNYEESHKRASEYLMTAKNLGESRARIQPVPQSTTSNNNSRDNVPKIDTLYTQRNAQTQSQNQNSMNIQSGQNVQSRNAIPQRDVGADTALETLNMNKNVGSNSGNGFNSELERVKSDVAKMFNSNSMNAVPNVSEDSGAIFDPNHLETINNVLKERAAKEHTESVKFESLNVESLEKQNVAVEQNNIITPKMPEVQEEPIKTIKFEEITIDKFGDSDTISASIAQEASVHLDNSATSEPELVKDNVSEVKKVEVEKVEEVKPQISGLDAKKLVEMMEEDGKLEEHSREIKTKPEHVKPRDSYAENTVDLSEMFKFKK